MARRRVTVTEVMRFRTGLRSAVRPKGRRARLVAGFAFAVVDAITFAPLLVLARLGLLSSRSSAAWREGGDGPEPLGGPFGGRDPDGGGAGAGVGARLPVVPPSLDGAAAKPLPD